MNQFYTVPVVEDDSTLLRRLVAELRDWGYRMTLAADGMAGLDAVLVDQPDIVVTNIHMPKMNWLQFLRAVRRVNTQNPSHSDPKLRPL